MTETTLHLSQIAGPVILLIGVSVLLNKKYYTKLFKKYDDNDSLFLAAIVEAACGLTIVLNHNLWQTLPEILISLLGWSMILESALILVGTQPWTKQMVRIISPKFLMQWATAVVILGGYLSWFGYFS